MDSEAWIPGYTIYQRKRETFLSAQLLIFLWTNVGFRQMMKA